MEGVAASGGAVASRMTGRLASRIGGYGVAREGADRVELRRLTTRDEAANRHRVTHGLSAAAAAAAQPRDSHSARVVMGSAHKARRPGEDFVDGTDAAHGDSGRREGERQRQNVVPDSSQRDDVPEGYHSWSHKQKKTWRNRHRRK